VSLFIQLHREPLDGLEQCRQEKAHGACAEDVNSDRRRWGRRARRAAVLGHLSSRWESECTRGGRRRRSGRARAGTPQYTGRRAHGCWPCLVVLCIV